jgi:hypothetical protein
VLTLASSGGAPPPPGVRPVWLLRSPWQSAATPFVGVIGDSTASQLAAALAERVRDRDVAVAIATVGGCQASDLALTYQNPSYLDAHRDCPRDAVDKQNALTRRFHPRVVVWSDVMEWSDIRAGDRTVPAGGDEWRRLMLAAWDRLLGRLGDARVALVLPSWWAGRPVDSPPSFPVGRQRALFRAWAEPHPGRVTLVDLAPLVCPGGPPCGQVVAGVRLRSDSLHYTPEGARRAAARIVQDVPPLRDLRGPAAPGDTKPG